MNTMNVADVLNDDRQLKALTGLGRDQAVEFAPNTSCLIYAVNSVKNAYFTDTCKQLEIPK